MNATEEEMPPPSGTQSKQPVALPSFQFLTAEQMMAPVGEPDWVVKGLGICPGRPAAIVGVGSSGKTSLALLLAACVAAGDRFLGQFFCPQYPVVWLDYEMGTRATMRKLRRLCKGHGLDFAAVVANLRIAVYPRTALNSPECEAELTKAVQGARLCFVDSLRRSLPGIDENDSRIADYLQMLSRVSEVTGCAFVFIHHGSTKVDQHGKKDRRSTARGSSAIWDGSGSHIVLDGPEGEPTAVTHVREPQEGATFAPFFIQIGDVAEGSDPKAGLRIEYITPEQATPKPKPSEEFDGIKAKVLEIVREHDVKSANAIVARAGLNKSKVLQAVKELREDKFIVEQGPYLRAAA